jgi:hypothetical protein
VNIAQCGYNSYVCVPLISLNPVGPPLRRHISAKNWKKSRNSQVSPDRESSYEDDDYDFLASSMTSQKTVCSDAFDFLFDEANLNPERVLQREFNATKTELELQQAVVEGERRRLALEKDAQRLAKTRDGHEPCCVIS